jgi:hypothetical protein
MREDGVPPAPDGGPDTANMTPPAITHSKPSPPRIKVRAVRPPLLLDPPVVLAVGVAVGVA